jgi:hypothetical protein
VREFAKRREEQRRCLAAVDALLCDALFSCVTPLGFAARCVPRLPRSRAGAQSTAKRGSPNAPCRRNQARQAHMKRR